MSLWCVEGRLPLFSLSDTDQVVGIPQVEFGEDRCPLELLKGGGELRKGIAVLHRNVVQTSIIDAGSQGLVLLANEEEPGPSR